MACKEARRQAQQPKSNPQDPRGGRRGATLTGCPLTSVHAPWQARACAQSINVIGRTHLGKSPFRGRHNDNCRFLYLSLFIFVISPGNHPVIISFHRQECQGSEWLFNSQLCTARSGWSPEPTLPLKLTWHPFLVPQRLPLSPHQPWLLKALAALGPWSCWPAGGTGLLLWCLHLRPLAPTSLQPPQLFFCFLGYSHLACIYGNRGNKWIP